MDIHRRWKQHINCSQNASGENYKYPLYRAMRKYGIDNFQFTILEECELNQEVLNQKEIEWIEKLQPEYNQTPGGDSPSYKSCKLNKFQIQDIQNILISDVKGEVSHKELARQYCVSQDTIQSINVGRSWRNSEYNYPLHYSKHDCRKPEGMIMKKTGICIVCGAPASINAKHCYKCYNQLVSRKRPSRQELSNLIRTKSFVAIGKQYGVTDNTIRKWCRGYNLPYKSKEIHQSDKPSVSEKTLSRLRSVVGTSLSNDIVFNFKSTSEAACWLEKNHYVSGNLNGVRSHISDACKGKRKTAYGFKWKYRECA